MEQKGAIYLRTRTWIRDSHELFDYEAKDSVIERDFCSNVNIMVVRNNNNIYCIDRKFLNQTRATGMDYSQYDHLLNIKLDEFNNFSIAPAERTEQTNNAHFIPKRLWLVVGNLPKKKYALEENDVIRLGRYRLRVKRIITDQREISSFEDLSLTEPDTNLLTPVKPQSDILLSNSSMSSFEPSPSQSNDSTNQVFTDECSEKQQSEELHVESDTTADIIYRQCRICLFDEETVDDKLICACQCKGSIKYVHTDCLRRWISSKMNVRANSDNQDMIFVREVMCELCKSKYPSKIKHDGEAIQLVVLPKMSSPIIILENSAPYALRGYHVLSLANNKELKLGRGHESDLRIPDVSISRYHATITYENGRFFLQDHASKFGTLVAITRPFVIKPTDLLTFQIGRSVIDASLGRSIKNTNGAFELINEYKPSDYIQPSIDLLPTKNIIRSAIGHAFSSLGSSTNSTRLFNANNDGDMNASMPNNAENASNTTTDPPNNSSQNRSNTQ